MDKYPGIIAIVFTAIVASVFVGALASVYSNSAGHGGEHSTEAAEH